MKIIKCIPIICVLAASLLSGCIQDERGDCARICNLIIKIVDESGNDITTSGVVDQATLYLFDSNDKFLEQIEVPAGTIRSRETIKLEYPGHPYLTAIIWCNIDDPNIVVDPVNPSYLITSDLDLYLVGSRATAMSGYPGELFHGKQVIAMPLGSGSTDISEVIASRKVSSIQINAKGLYKFFPTNNPDADYRLEVSGTSDSFELIEGRLCSDAGEAIYTPQITFDGTSHSTKLFNTFPSGNGGGVTVKIYQGNTLIYTATVDKNGNRFVAVEGHTLIINIDFSAGDVKIDAEVVPWGDLNQSVTQ